MGQLRSVVPVLLLLAVVNACRPQPGATPHSALIQYTDALEEGRIEDAYLLLSDESRADLSLEAFRDLVKNNPDEVRALITAAQREEHPPLVTAEFETESGQVLTLIYENGAWRIDSSAVNLYDQSEPRIALHSFLRAFDRKRYDILLLFVPDSQKDDLSVEVLKDAWEGEQRIEMEQITEELRSHLDASKIEVLGDRATMSYGAGGHVELVRERGAWKIEDLK